MTNDNPWILGLSASMHNGAACLLRGDEIVVAIQEERLSRKKRDAIMAAYPSLALDYCLNYAGISPADLSLVVYCVAGRAQSPIQDVSQNPLLKTRHHQIGTLMIPHHLGHAVSGFATSGFADSAILVIDGSGSAFEDLSEDERRACKWKVADGFETISLYGAAGVEVRALEKQCVERGAWVSANHEPMLRFGSLGGMYSAVAAQIFGDLLEAGKVMGLAPYGRPTIPAREFFSADNGLLTFHDQVQKRFRFTERWPAREQEYKDLACSTQNALEEAVLYLVERLYELYPSDNLCYAGGVALNSVANERIIRESPFKNVYIMPAAEDSGPAIGAAYYGLWHLTRQNNRPRLVHDAVGRAYSSQAVAGAIEKNPAVQVVASRDVISDTVDRLCDGKIIGWYQGRSELGPRALGQRSILCDPRRQDGKEVLNRRVKHREAFRPFAPVILLEHARDWFDIDGTTPESRFMLRVCKFREGKKEMVPAVVHVDDTGRFQTLTAAANGRLYELVKKFYEKTGVPILLNTSFNVNGEPIVETPEDAIAAFLSTGIDYCVVQDTIVEKRKQILFEFDERAWPERLIAEVIKANQGNSNGSNGAGDQSPKETPAPLTGYAGTFEHPTQGLLTIEAQPQGLIATLTSGAVFSKHYAKTAPLKHCYGNTFQIANDYFKDFVLTFLPDAGSHMDCVALSTRRSLARSQFFMRVIEPEAMSQAAIQRLLGQYEAEGKVLNIFLRGEDTLMAAVPGEAGFELSGRNGAEFFLKSLPGHRLGFELDASGEVSRVVVSQPGRVSVLAKKA